MRTIVWFLLVFLFSFTGVALAAGAAAPDDGSLLDLLRPVYDAFAGGHYPYAGMLALVLAVALLKRYAPAKFGISDFVHGDVGGTLTTLLGSFAAAMAASLAGGAGVTLAMAKTASLIAVGAAGGYTMIKKLIVEPLRNSDWYKSRAPEWLKSIMQVAMWIFDKPSPVAAAEDAGQKAVDASPPTGTIGVVGQPKDVE